ncbi:MAG: mucoidy inhibitor MuiA family protein [Rhodospirillales bacterium]|nr:mucoidy inhibitor MuiA family protein [Rhodospirillales bacterium]
MRYKLTALFLVTSAFSPAFAADIAALSKVDAVTVFPQGAEVIRSVDVRIPAGDHRLIFEGLPSDLQSETLRVEGSAGSTVEIGSIDSKFAYAPAAAIDAERKRIEGKMETLNDERGLLDQTIADAEYQKSLMQQLASSIFAPPPKPENAEKHGPEDLANLLNLVGARLQTFSKTVTDARIRQRAIDKEIQDLNNQLAGLAPQDQGRFTVAVNLSVPAETAGTFKLKYRIANAGWHPIYDARLTSPAKDTKASIELVRRAEVMQATTESWDNVSLKLSTARPVGATSAPDISPQEVQLFEPGRDQSYHTSMDALEKDKATLENAPATAPAEAGSLMVQKAEKRRDVAQSQAQVQIAGFQAIYEVPGKVSIDNTGTAKKVRIGTDQISAALSAFTVPKLDPNAYLTATFSLGGETPMLPGLVLLYRDGVFMGQGALPLLSPGEETKLGFGADDLIKVKRVEVKSTRGEEGLLTTSNIDERFYDITVKNLHDFDLPVTVLDQIPFTSAQDVTITIPAGMTTPTRKDVDKKRGVLGWDIDLAAKGETVIKHGFKVAWPEGVQVGMNQE